MEKDSVKFLSYILAPVTKYGKRLCEIPFLHFGSCNKIWKKTLWNSFLKFWLLQQNMEKDSVKFLSYILAPVTKYEENKKQKKHSLFLGQIKKK